MPSSASPAYHINIFFSPRDDCYIADIPDLRFCSASGETPEEGLAEALVARDLFLESCQRHGDPIPPARYRPVIYSAGAG